MDETLLAVAHGDDGDADDDYNVATMITIIMILIVIVAYMCKVPTSKHGPLIWISFGV